MKSKLLTFIAAIAASTCVSVVQAQTDVTTTYIKNPGFEGEYTVFAKPNTDRAIYQPEGWSVVYTGGDSNDMTFVAPSFTQDSKTWNAKEGNSYFTRQRWANSTIQLTQELQELPEGKYVLKAQAAAFGTGTSVIYVTANGNTTTTNVTVGNADPATWNEYTVTFNMPTSGNATIGLRSVRNGNNLKTGYDNFTLLYYGIDKTELNNKITEATTLYGDGNGIGASDLNVAIQIATTVANNTNATLNEVINATSELEAAIFTFNFLNATPSNPANCTHFITNPSFETGDFTGWTLGTKSGDTGVKLNSDGAYTTTGVDGNYLYNSWSACTPISQTIRNLPEGAYKVKVLLASDPNCPQVVYANNTKVEATNLTKNTFSLWETPVVNIAEGDSLTFGLEADNSWIKADHFQLYYLGDVLVADLKNDLSEALIKAKAIDTTPQMYNAVKQELSSAIEEGEDLFTNSTDKTLIFANLKRLRDVAIAINRSIEAYEALSSAIQATETLSSNATWSDNTLFNQTLQNAKDLYEGQTADDKIVKNTILELSNLKTIQTSGEFTYMVNDPTMDGGRTNQVWHIETTDPDYNFQGLNTAGKNYTGMSGYALESWNPDNNGAKRNRKIYQIIENIPNGTYTVTCAAFAVYQKSDGQNQNKDGVSFYANKSSVKVPINWSTANSAVYTIEKAIVTNGTLEIGLKAENAYMNWFAIDNVTLTKIDEILVLDENNAFNASVNAATKASYTRAFNMNGAPCNQTNGNWQTICLPFDVTAVKSTQSGNEISLIPISGFTGTEGTNDPRPFWVYEIGTDNKLNPATEMKANVPYLVAIPNDASTYRDFYNVSGDVTFSGTQILVTNPETGTTGTYSMTANFNPITANANDYGINAEGTYFVPSVDIKSFNAKIAPVGTGKPAYLSIFGDDSDLTSLPAIPSAELENGIEVYTSANGVTIQSEKEVSLSIFEVSGKLVKEIRINEGLNYVTLPAGQYVINGSVIIVK